MVVYLYNTFMSMMIQRRAQLLKKGGRTKNCVNFSRDYKVYARAVRNFGKKAIKSTIFELQQKNLYIFGVAQNF